MATGRVNVGGGGVGLNIFTQMTEPATKEGIWLKTKERYKKVLIDTAVDVAGDWNDVTTSPIENAPSNIVQSTCVADGNVIYILGGYTGAASGSYYNSFYKYNVGTNTWTTLANSPVSISVTDAILKDNKIYVYGGNTLNGVNNYMYIYDIATNTWSQNAHYNGERVSSRAVLRGDKIYYVGGHNSLGGLHDRILVYDIPSNTFTLLTYGAVKRTYFTSFVLGNKLYMLGGRITSLNSGGDATNTCVSIDLDTGIITPLANMPTTNAFAFGTYVNGDFYVFGGQTNGGIGYEFQVDTIYKYNVGTNTWTTLEKTMPYKVSRGVSAMIGDKFYIFGGVYAYTAIRTNRYFNFVSKQYDDKTVVILKTDEITGTYYSELLTPNVDILGDVNMKRLLSPFDDVFMHIGGGLNSYETYYGDGTKWIKIKEAN